MVAGGVGFAVEVVMRHQQIPAPQAAFTAGLLLLLKPLGMWHLRNALEAPTSPIRGMGSHRPWEHGGVVTTRSSTANQTMGQAMLSPQMPGGKQHQETFKKNVSQMDKA